MTLSQLYSKRKDLIERQNALRRQKRSTEIVQHQLIMLTTKIIRAEIREEQRSAA